MNTSPTFDDHTGEQSGLAPRLPSESQREDLMVQVAKLYYDLEKNQSDIARETGLTRWQVSRLLRDARDSGVVRIEIVARSTRLPHLEAQLQRRYGLREALVVADNEDASALNSVTQMAARYLCNLQPAPDLIGVSWGRTLTKMAQWLTPRWNEALNVVLLNGAINTRSVGEPSHNVAERFAQAARGQATLLPVPAILGSAHTREALEQDPIIASVLQLGQKAPVACFSLGELSQRSVLLESGYIDEALLAELARRGAVGDIMGRFIGADGQVVMPELDQRTLGLHPQALRDKAWSIAVCVGAAKHAVVLACLRAGYANVLATDQATAHFLLGAAS
ncbi:sugar-binding transcriptional regulator [Pseudomonas sp. HR96]|uniref:sugar-binding transcriptional regulator n=1 Tax=Pseudomonas sp. HR96 TaxID=1027966 RepID=UPI002A75120B|nr:sugar-binding transcriptional regulator [Pseudomonas sp. HR96]WPP01147.1 sugar-binding transcriptional regulator [Pseudomonas sp. HR96]